MTGKCFSFSRFFYGGDVKCCDSNNTFVVVKNQLQYRASVLGRIGKRAVAVADL